MSRFRSLLLCVTVGASLVQAAPGDAAGAAPRITGITKLSSTGGSKSAVVEVPNKVWIDSSTVDARKDGPNSDVSISGKGAFVGVAFVNRSTDEAVTMRNLLIVGRWDVCDGGGCPREHVYYVQGNASARRVVLLPGTYDVHLIGGPGPIEITLRFHGGTGGATKVVADEPSPVDLKAPPAEVTRTDQGAYVASSGSEFDTGRVGFSVSLMYVRAERPLDSLSGGVCQINGPTAPPRHLFGPQCFALTRAGFGPGHYSIAESVRGREYTLMPLFSYAENDMGQMPTLDGRRGLGAWVATPYPLQDFRFAGLFVKIR